LRFHESHHTGSRRPAWIGASGFVAALLCSVSVLATTLVARDLSGLCSEAEIAFVGTVTEVRSQWAEVDHRAVETLVTFSDVTPLLGAAGEEQTVRFAGGEIDGIREQVAGMPRFSRGDRVVLLLRRTRSASPIIGFNQGLFRVIDGPDGPVVSNAAGLPLVKGEGGSLEPSAEYTPKGEFVPLAAFLSILRFEFDRR